MTQQIHFITYGDDVFKNSKKRIFEEASMCQWFDTINVYGPETLDENFKKEFSNILRCRRGGGYWLWKFYIIERDLSRIKTDDILIYLDAGCTINLKGKQRFTEYVDMLNNSCEPIISFQLTHKEKKYTIKELFHYFDMDVNDNNGESGQFLSGILIMKNTDKMKKMISECTMLLHKNVLLTTDHYNKLGQCSDFIENRHDQSILSLVCKKYGSIVLEDETWFARYGGFGSIKSFKYPFWATRKR